MLFRKKRETNKQERCAVRCDTYDLHEDDDDYADELIEPSSCTCTCTYAKEYKE